MSLTTTQSAVSMKFAGHFPRVGVPESLGVAALEQQRLDLMSGSGLTVVASMLEERFGGRRGTMSTAFVALAVSSGVVAIAIAGAVVLVVLLVTVSMRGRQKRGAKERGEARRDAKERGEARRDAKERGEARRDADEAREAGREERDRDTAREGGEDLGPDR
jgi:hypothetical protein